MAGVLLNRNVRLLLRLGDVQCRGLTILGATTLVISRQFWPWDIAQISFFFPLKNL